MHDFQGSIMPIGPQHPALKEPIYFELELKGSEVIGAKQNLGYVHRGIEKILEGKTIDAAMHATDYICGICSMAHSGTSTRALEDSFKIKTSMNVKLHRVIIGELERIHSHLLWAGVMMHEIGIDSWFMFFWREREKILDVFDKTTGARVHHAVNMIGTVKRAFTEEDIKYIREKVTEVSNYVKKHYKGIKNDGVIRERFVDIGKISMPKAERYGLVGPVARTTGIKEDLRKDDPYWAYNDVKFKVIMSNRGDAMARLLARLEEIEESAKIISQCCDKYEVEKGVEKKAVFPTKENYFAGHTEAPRGEVFHTGKTKGGYIEKYRIRTPTYSNITIYAKLLIGADVTDVPVVIQSMDPCFSCMDRMVIVKKNKREVLSGKQFMAKYCDHHD
jgi:NADH-quinone oxidoreductase subunit D